MYWLGSSGGTPWERLGGALPAHRQGRVFGEWRTADFPLNSNGCNDKTGSKYENYKHLFCCLYTCLQHEVTVRESLQNLFANVYMFDE